MIFWTEEIVTLEKLKEFSFIAGFIREVSFKLKTSVSLEPTVTKNFSKVSVISFLFVISMTFSFIFCGKLLLYRVITGYDISQGFPKFSRILFRLD